MAGVASQAGTPASLASIIARHVSLAAVPGSDASIQDIAIAPNLIIRRMALPGRGRFQAMISFTTRP
jgi:hypothetical protein